MHSGRHVVTTRLLRGTGCQPKSSTTSARVGSFQHSGSLLELCLGARGSTNTTNNSRRLLVLLMAPARHVGAADHSWRVCASCAARSDSSNSESRPYTRSLGAQLDARHAAATRSGRVAASLHACVGRLHTHNNNTEASLHSNLAYSSEEWMRKSIRVGSRVGPPSSRYNSAVVNRACTTDMLLLCLAHCAAAIACSVIVSIDHCSCKRSASMSRSRRRLER